MIGKIPSLISEVPILKGLVMDRVKQVNSHRNISFKTVASALVEKRGGVARENSVRWFHIQWMGKATWVEVNTPVVWLEGCGGI